jgi:threonine dehydrogenase-like Zn-dependent dehydrogenase
LTQSAYVVVAERKIVGSFAYTDFVFEETVRLLATGQLDLSDLIGATTSLEDAPGVFADLADGRRHEIKIMVAVAAAAQ